MEKLFNTYTLQARVLPACIMLLPIFTTIVSCYPSVMDKSMYIPLVVVGIILLSILTHFIRKLGKQIEPKLYEEWGGKSSVILLRENDCTIEKEIKSRYKKVLEAQIPISFPLAHDELQDPLLADQKYHQASDWLLSNTRDTEAYPLVFAENIHYGFRRNVYGTKQLTTTICLLSIAFTILIITLNWDTANPNLWPWANLTFLFPFTLAWIMCVKSDWVKESAYTFAYQLLMTCNDKKLTS